MATVSLVDNNEPTPEELRGTLSDPDALYEVENGRVVEVPGMSAYGSLIAHRLMDGIQTVIRPARLGFVLIENLFILDSGANLRRRPDVAFVSYDRWPLDRPIPTTGDSDVVPDLAVEVIGPSDPAGKIARKVHEYLRLGVRQVWVVYPETREIVVYRSAKQIEVFEDGDILSADDLISGLRLPVSGLFSTTIG